MPPGKKAALAIAFIAGLVLIMPQVAGDADPLTLGPPYPSFVAAGLALVATIVLASPIVRWLGGDAAVSDDMKKDAANAMPGGGLLGVAVGQAMELTAREGMSPRDQRILIGFLAFFPLLSALMALTNFVNGTFVSAPESVVCKVTSAARIPKSERLDVTLSCTLPSGELQRARGYFDTLPTPPETTDARRGALGVWLLPKSGVQR